VTRYRFAIGVLAVVALAAALRLWKLGEWSYWSDEAFTISDANAVFAGDTTRRIPEHRLSYLVYGAAYAAARSLGIAFDERVARALPALFGILGVAATAVLGRRSAGRSGALLGAFLVALAPLHLYWSQNARGYALEIALAVPGGLLLGSGLLAGRLAELVPGALLLGLAAFTHPTALLLGPPLLAFAALGRRFGGEHVRALPVGLLLGLGVTAFVAIFFTPLGHALRVHYKVKPDGSPGLFVLSTAYYFRPALLAAAAPLAIRGLRRRDRASLLLTLASFGTLATGFLASFVARANVQYVVVAFPFLCLLIGREIMELGAKTRLGGVALGLALVADVAGGAALYFGPERGHRASWREACELVWRRAEPGDGVASTQASIVECYLNPANERPRDASASLYLGRFDPEKLERFLKLRRRVWILVLEVDLEDWKEADRARFREFLREGCRMVSEWPLQIEGKDQTLKVWRYDPS